MKVLLQIFIKEKQFLFCKNKFLDVEIYFATHFDKGKPRPAMERKL